MTIHGTVQSMQRERVFISFFLISFEPIFNYIFLIMSNYFEQDNSWNGAGYATRRSIYEKYIVYYLL